MALFLVAMLSCVLFLAVSADPDFTDLQNGSAPFGVDSYHFQPWFSFKSDHFKTLPSNEVQLAMIRSGIEYHEPLERNSFELTVYTPTESFKERFEYFPGTAPKFPVVLSEKYTLADIVSVRFDFDLYTESLAAKPALSVNFIADDWSMELGKLSFDSAPTIGDKLVLNNVRNNLGNRYLSFTIDNWDNNGKLPIDADYDFVLRANATKGGLFELQDEANCRFSHEDGTGDIDNATVNVNEGYISWQMKSFPAGKNVKFDCTNVHLNLTHFNAKNETGWIAAIGPHEQPQGLINAASLPMEIITEWEYDVQVSPFVRSSESIIVEVTKLPLIESESEFHFWFDGVVPQDGVKHGLKLISMTKDGGEAAQMSEFDLIYDGNFAKLKLPFTEGYVLKTISFEIFTVELDPSISIDVYIYNFVSNTNHVAFHPFPFNRVPPLFEVVDVGLTKRSVANTRDFTFLFSNTQEFKFEGDGLISVSSNSTQIDGGKCLFVLQGDAPKCQNLALEDVPATFDKNTCTVIFDGIKGKLQISKSSDAVQCSNLHLDFSSNKNQIIEWTFAAKNPEMRTNVEYSKPIDDVIPPGPVSWPFNVDIAPVSTYSPLLKFSITNFPTPIVNFGYEYNINIKLSGVKLHDDYSLFNSTLLVHHITKTTYQGTPVKLSPQSIKTTGENSFNLEKVQFLKPDGGDATQLGIQFELSTSQIDNMFQFTLEVVSIKDPKNQYQFTSQHPTRLPSLVKDDTKVATKYLPSTDNSNHFGFEITLPSSSVPMNQVFILSTNTTLSMIDTTPLFKPIGDENCQVNWTGAKTSKDVRPAADFYSQSLIFDFKALSDLSQVGKDITITCKEWVMVPPIKEVKDIYMAYSLTLVDVKEEENGLESSFTPQGVTWVAKPISESDSDDSKKGPGLVVAIVVVILLAIAGAGAAYYFLVHKKKQNAYAQEGLLNDSLEDEYNQVV